MRDATALLGLGAEPNSQPAAWRLVTAEAHLFFPATEAIETLMVLEEIV